MLHIYKSCSHICIYTFMYECIYVYNFKWSCTAQGDNAPHKSHRLTKTSVPGMENIPQRDIFHQGGPRDSPNNIGHCLWLPLRTQRSLGWDHLQR